MLKMLGVKWLPDEDVFTFKPNPPEKGFELTKRNCLKKIAKLFIPVGFLAPFIIHAKFYYKRSGTQVLIGTCSSGETWLAKHENGSVN